MAGIEVSVRVSVRKTIIVNEIMDRSVLGVAVAMGLRAESLGLERFSWAQKHEIC